MERVKRGGQRGVTAGRFIEEEQRKSRGTDINGWVGKNVPHVRSDGDAKNVVVAQKLAGVSIAHMDCAGRVHEQKDQFIFGHIVDLAMSFDSRDEVLFNCQGPRFVSLRALVSEVHVVGSTGGILVGGAHGLRLCSQSSVLARYRLLRLDQEVWGADKVAVGSKKSGQSCIFPRRSIKGVKAQCERVCLP